MGLRKLSATASFRLRPQDFENLGYISCTRVQGGDNDYLAKFELTAMLNLEICGSLEGITLTTDCICRTCKYLLGSKSTFDLGFSVRIFRVPSNDELFRGPLPKKESGLATEEA